MAHLLLFLPRDHPGSPGERRTRRSPMLERRVGSGKDGVEARERPVRDEAFLARQHVVVPGTLGTGLQPPGVAPPAGFGQAERSEVVVRTERREHALLLLRGAAEQDRLEREAVRDDRRRHAGARAGELLDDQALLGQGEATAAELGRDIEVHQPELPGLLVDLNGEAAGPIALGGMRGHLGPGELPREVLQAPLVLGERIRHATRTRAATIGTRYIWFGPCDDSGTPGTPIARASIPRTARAPLRPLRPGWRVRTGVPEVILAEGKTTEHLLESSSPCGVAGWGRSSHGRPLPRLERCAAPPETASRSIFSRGGA